MTILGHLEQHPGLNPPDFTAIATAVTDNSIEMDQTFYYPMGGGQPADRGIISGESFECIVTDVTKKKSVDVELGWTPSQSGEYVLKLYVMDATTMGAVLKDPIINNISVEPANTSLASGPESTKD